MCTSGRNERVSLYLKLKNKKTLRKKRAQERSQQKKSMKIKYARKKDL